ncbi:sulfotransferase domain-containing protein [Planosporangium mesophilum]|uniref:Glycolipid sulfotransferase n=1 Tax=Planosporangium mesophilum TaxID=689768 RepID=A0A8J3TFT5_9ACTN|nr:sulfotransferase domain-containing protein [Planosporangium mesophilum]NJC85766.1 sulfotransferase domain-containing protein [Planosporangium mesophilum]GII24766.1 glycolipid sulfotransferase [Planosporangium mesophilum]
MAGAARVTYRSGLTDSSRWERFPFRPGDIVISTPSKCGTTWMQMICALLIFQSADLPASLTTLSPWLDMRLRPIDEVLALLEAQQHRRFIKTHTPLDGLPQVDGVTYVCVGRDPRDVAVSMDHHRANLNRDVFERLLPQKHHDARTVHPGRPGDQRERVLRWILDPRPPTMNLDSLRGVVRHLGGAWARRQEPAVVLMHHAELSRDLYGQMRSLAGRLGITMPGRLWPTLVEAASFDRMRARAGDLVPDERLGLFSNRDSFFRSGRPEQWRAVFTADDLVAYEDLLRSLAPEDLMTWLANGR